MDHDNDAAVLEAKEKLRPAMERVKGVFRCPLCGLEQKADGNCPADGIPLRRLSSSEH